MYEVVEAFRRVYCSTTGYDYAHVFVPEERRWLRTAAEGGRFRAPVDPIDPHALLDRVTKRASGSRRRLSRGRWHACRKLLQSLDLGLGMGLDTGRMAETAEPS